MAPLLNRTWPPTVDGSILPEHPFWTSAPGATPGVPLIVGSTLTEFGVPYGDPEFEKGTFEKFSGYINKGHRPEHAKRILDALRCGHPGASAAKVFTIWCSSGVRHAAVRQAALKPESQRPAAMAGVRSCQEAHNDLRQHLRRERRSRR